MQFGISPGKVKVKGKGVKYAVHHCKKALTPAFFQCWPVHRFEQESYIGGMIEVASNIADTYALSIFSFVGVALSVWVPHW